MRTAREPLMRAKIINDRCILISFTMHIIYTIFMRGGSYENNT